MASLSPLAYDRARKDAAAALGVSTTTLDKAVALEKREGKTDSGIGFEDCEPYPHPINPAELLSELSDTVKRFIVCQDETADAAALWAAFTWFIDVVQVAPIAVITAPEKRCGKSMLLFLLGKLSRRPLTASNISPAGLFRTIDAWKPTLLIDEADAFMRENEELRGLLNSGHTRDSAYTVRIVGEAMTPTRFSTWGAKAIAGIGHLADTLMDRSICLELRRKMPHETRERLRHAPPDLFDTLTAKLARFAEDYREQVRRARPLLPSTLNDRAQDNWEALIAIAECAGHDWTARAWNAALILSGDATAQSVSNELLADIQTVFEHKRLEKISSKDLLSALCEDEEAAWCTHNRGKPLSARQLSKRLSEYGISSKNIRLGAYNTPKGFDLSQFQEAFARYLEGEK
jgi:putative DNA primase/helicase